MSVKVLIPTALQRFTSEKASIESDAESIGKLLDALEVSFPGIKSRLYDDEKNDIRRFVNFYVNSEDIRFLKGIETPLENGDEVSIVPAVAGG